MEETPEELAELQRVLDASYAVAGPHLADVHRDRVRLTADEVTRRWQGMRVAVVATATRDGRPLTGPVDAFLFRGRVVFGTAPTAVRARHLRRRPAVSVTWADGEATVVTMHGRARPLDLAGADRGFAALCRAQYGDGWDDWAADSAYFAVEPERMFAADMARHATGD